MEGSIAKSRSGKAKVDAVSESIRAITAESERVRVLVTEVHAGSREQGRGVQQITETILQLQKVTESNATSAKQSATAAEELNMQSGALSSVVESLSVLVYGSKALS